MRASCSTWRGSQGGEDSTAGLLFAIQMDWHVCRWQRQQLTQEGRGDSHASVRTGYVTPVGEAHWYRSQIRYALVVARAGWLLLATEDDKWHWWQPATGLRWVYFWCQCVHMHIQYTRNPKIRPLTLGSERGQVEVENACRVSPISLILFQLKHMVLKNINSFACNQLGSLQRMKFV